MTVIDAERVAGIIRETAALDIVPRFGELRADEIGEKQLGSVVTAADLDAEARLTRLLGEVDPDAGIVGEEAADGDSAVLGRLDTDRPVWLIDPVDGTANFAAGDERFAVMVAYVVGGAAVLGWIYEPVSGRMAIAESGEGAWLDGARLGLPAPPELARQSGFLARRLRRDAAVSARLGPLHNWRCVGVEYVALAQGRLHFAHFRRLNPWDHAAGSLIHHEAGGVNACLDGSAYRPRAPDPGGLLLAADRPSWRALRDIIRPALGS